MPVFKDKEGKDRYSMNPQVGRAMHGGSAKKGEGEKAAAKPPHEGGGHSPGGGTKLVSHGDGTYHTEHEDGQRVEHPHLGHALMHAAHHHEAEGKHSYVHHSGAGGHSSSHVDENGEHSGPHEHANTQDLKDSFDSFTGEGGAVAGDYGGGNTGSPVAGGPGQTDNSAIAGLLG